MAIKYNIATDGEAAEKQIFANCIRLYAQYRGNLLNISDGKEYDISLLTDLDLTPDKFPGFYRNAASGKINKTGGYLTALGMKEMADGRFCYIQAEDYVYKMPNGEDEDGNPLFIDYQIEYSKIPLNFTWDSITETEPEWKVYEEE